MPRFPESSGQALQLVSSTHIDQVQSTHRTTYANSEHIGIPIIELGETHTNAPKKGDHVNHLRFNRWLRQWQGR